MLFQVEKMNGANYQQPNSPELGQFIIKWSFETGWETLLEESCKSFKLLYNINYQLWKIADLARKKALKSNDYSTQLGIRPVVLREGFLDWSRVLFSFSSTGSDNGEPIRFRVLKNIVTSLNGYIVINYNAP